MCMLVIRTLKRLLITMAFRSNCFLIQFFLALREASVLSKTLETNSWREFTDPVSLEQPLTLSIF